MTPEIIEKIIKEGSSDQKDISTEKGDTVTPEIIEKVIKEGESKDV